MRERLCHSGNNWASRLDGLSIIRQVHKQLIKGLVDRLWAGVFTLAARASAQGAPPFFPGAPWVGAEAGPLSPWGSLCGTLEPGFCL